MESRGDMRRAVLRSCGSSANQHFQRVRYVGATPSPCPLPREERGRGFQPKWRDRAVGLRLVIAENVRASTRPLCGLLSMTKPLDLLEIRHALMSFFK